MQESPNFVHLETFKVGEAEYSISERPCDECGEPLHMLGRWCNLKVTALVLPCGYDLTAIQNLAESMEESFQFNSESMLRNLTGLIDSVSGPDGGYFHYEDEKYELVRIADSARRALNFFAKAHDVDELKFEGSEPENGFQAAFMLGYLASDREWMTIHADALRAGYIQQEARERGAEARRDARTRAVERTRKIAADALRELPSWGRSGATGKGISDFAKEVRRRALKEAGDHFFTGKKPLSVNWFKQEIENALADGAFKDIMDQ